MKYSNIRAYEKHLQGSAPQHFAPVYLILSKEDFLRKETITLTIDSILPKGKESLALQKFDGRQLNADRLREELDTPSLFAPRRLIVIDFADKLAKPLVQQLERFAARPQPGLFLIIAASSVASNTTLFKLSEKAGVVLDLAEEKPREKEARLSDWVLQKFAERGKTTTLQVCQMLAKQVASDGLLLENEIEKLLCYVGDRPKVTPQDVRDVCVDIPSETIWQFGEAIFMRNGAAALRMVRAILDSSTSFHGFLYQIRRQMQTEYQVASLLASGAPTEEITKLFPYMRGFILETHMRQAQAYGLERFKKAMQWIDEMDLLAKNRAFDNDDLMAEMLVAKLVS